MTLIPLTASNKFKLVFTKQIVIKSDGLVPSSGLAAIPRLLYEVMVTNLFDLVVACTPLLVEETFLSFAALAVDGVFADADGVFADKFTAARFVLAVDERDFFTGKGGWTGRKGRTGAVVVDELTSGLVFAFFGDNRRGGALTVAAWLSGLVVETDARDLAGAFGDLGASFDCPLSFLITVGWRRGLFRRTDPFLLEKRKSIC